ncbi:MAG: tryptophan--tRNA ligase, partial [Betaproteobacteria bacterium]|nr:tryptophan--tRNA ligase [Betaproteobacteria bacterium]
MARIVSGMRPTGALHLGHLRGVLHNWRALQDAGDECYFFVADWHALTTDYAAPENLRQYGRDMVSAWLAAGVDPARAVIFRQSDVPAHAELYALLSMICPLPWLAHLPSYKEQAARRELDTYGFLGYP